ncbi:response regulator transcription factor [Bacillus sp. USDA818B3_A]|uniref:response regulator transcription factor n=1 Tax=Bacillus sp. USDA818B3_A TaxID=2698834 RepID=UPI001369200B|nr:response regulator transcription factor [Bacillus sp. USDA818B3_A]
MYKVMLVDDERIITEGMSKVIKWESIGTSLIGTAKNGLEAFEKIKQSRPDIVISDIKMPGMNGLELVAKVHEYDPEIRFILLSGFSEFDYAKQAMVFGVKHYLLKPCNEHTIMDALKEIGEELNQTREREQFIERMKDTLKNVLPYAKEQLLKEYVTNVYENRDFEYYQKLLQLDLETPKVRLMLFQIEGEFEFEHLLAIKNIAEQIFKEHVLSCSVGELNLLLINNEVETSLIHQKMEQIRKTFYQYYQLDCTIAVSETGRISQANKLYKEALDCLNYRFYLGEGSIITKEDIEYKNNKFHEEFYYDDQKFCRLVKTGCWVEVEEEITIFFNYLTELRFDINATKSYVIQLFNSMIRLCDSNQMNAYLIKLSLLLELETIQSMKSFFKEMAEEITSGFYQQNKNKHSAIISRVLEVIENHLADPQLSLQWVANEMLYMNADYLGKLFKKETGEKFSNYLTKVRISKAISMIENESDVKIFELAEKIGFGENAQYFSQVFKKQTGFTPSEYKRETVQGL